MLLLSNKIILYESFFIAAFLNKPLYLPFLLLYVLIRNLNIVDTLIDRKTLIFIFLISYFLVTIYTIGYDRLYLPNPIYAMLYVLLLIFIGGHALYFESPKSRSIAIVSYALGLFTENLCVATYSFYTNPVVYGYGNLISPFSDGQVNSPSVSNSLAIGFVILEFLLITGKSKLLQVILLILTIVTFSMGVFLAGRAFFVIIIINTFVISFFHKKFRNVLLLFLAIIGIYVIFFSSSIEYSSNTFDTLFFRRMEMGIESGRFPLFIQGSSELILHPFGGFSVDRSIEDTYWFHNIFIDAGRVAGWLPVLLLIIAIFIVVKKRVNTISHENFDVSDLVFLTTLFLIQQDVIIEGDYKKFVLFYFSCLSLLLIKNKNNYSFNR